MNRKITLKDKIVRSIFIYEVRKVMIETFFKLGIFLTSLFIIAVFGGVIFDIFSENELGEVIGSTNVKDMISILYNEIPQWVTLGYVFGILLGCILILSIIKNWSYISLKLRSIVKYWFSL